MADAASEHALLPAASSAEAPSSDPIEPAPAAKPAPPSHLVRNVALAVSALCAVVLIIALSVVYGGRGSPHGGAGDGGGSVGALSFVAPPVGSASAISGTVAFSGSAVPTNYKALAFVVDTSGGLWSCGSTPLAPNGSFFIAGWAATPPFAAAATAIAVEVLIVPQSLSPSLYVVAGAQTLPAGLLAASVAASKANRGVAASSVATPSPTRASPTPSPTPSGAAAVTPSPSRSGGSGTIQFVVNLPGIGNTGAVNGVVKNTLQSPTAYTAVVFIVDAGGNFFGPRGAGATPGSNGVFSITGWSLSASDANAPSLGVFLMPSGTVVPQVNGGTSLPPNIMSAQVAYAVQSRSVAQPPLPSPVQWTAAASPTPAAGGGGAGGSAWPPGAISAPVGANNGVISWSGYNWQVKDSGGGAVGPGPNVFNGGTNFVWVDNWGAHLNVRPTCGCGCWASSEFNLDHSLGYGTYFFSSVGPIQNLDPQVTWGLFLWDDTAGPGIGYREIDFEYARWGNGGDPTAGQFVLEPLRPGNLPGWKVRWYASGVQTMGGANGAQGGGGCNDGGNDYFNGAQINKISCALVWGPGQLNWNCWDGLWTLATVGGATSLIGSYTYGATQYVPPPGNERFHFNLWQANAGAPQWNRRVHAVNVHFEFTTTLVNFNTAQNHGIVQAGRRLAHASHPLGNSTDAPPQAVGYTYQ